MELEPTEKLVTWDDAWPDGTVDLAYEECSRQQALFADWADAIDNKVVAVFSVGSAIMGVVPALRTPDTQGLPVLFWLIAVGCWIAAALSCYKAYRPIGLLMGPSPHNLLNDGWLGYTPKQFKYQRIRRLGDSFAHNGQELDRKAGHLAHATWFTAGEVLSLTIAVYLS